MAYCTPDEVRELTGLTTTDVSDSVLSGIIRHAIAQVNADIQIQWKDEPVQYINNEKENDIDGTNTTFYTKHYPIGDRDNNGTICGVDIYAYVLDQSGTREDILVTTIDNPDIGKVTLSKAPSSGDALYFTYYSSPVNMSDPHQLVKLACIRLAAALAFTRIDASKIQGFRIGKVAVTKQSQAFDIYLRQYYDLINKIRSEAIKVEEGDKVI